MLIVEQLPATYLRNRKRISFGANSALNTSRVQICWLEGVNNSRIDVVDKTPLHQQHLNEIKNKRGSSVVNFRKERKKTNHKQLDRAILKYKITYLEQMLPICDGKLFKISPKQGLNGSNYKATRPRQEQLMAEKPDSQLLVPSLDIPRRCD